MWRPMSKILNDGVHSRSRSNRGIYKQYGLDRPAALQYVLWMSNFLLKGEMGALVYLPTTREGRYHGASAHVGGYSLSLFGNHLADRYPHRHLLRVKTVFGGRLHRYRHRLCRARFAQLPAGVGNRVLGIRRHRTSDLRVFFL